MSFVVSELFDANAQLEVANDNPKRPGTSASERFDAYKHADSAGAFLATDDRQDGAARRTPPNDGDRPQRRRPFRFPHFARVASTFAFLVESA